MHPHPDLVRTATLLLTGLIVVMALNGLILRFAILPMLVVYAQMRQCRPAHPSMRAVEHRLRRIEGEIGRLHVAAASPEHRA